jgi:myo-inositol 2-dehydrogenase/D-chiro-inositol 1-dehydrogenase
MVTKLKVALLGAGLMGRFHGDTLANLARADLTYVIDADRTAAQHVADLTAGAVVETEAEVALANPEVDAVVIVTPAPTHAELIIRAAQAGKAIFCEKPLGVSLEEAARAKQAVVEAGVPFQIGFQRRFDPGVQRLRKLISAGELGRLEMFRSVTADPAGPSYERMQLSAGIFHDTLSHDMDMALAFFGAISEVHARGAAMTDPRFTEIGKPDTTVISLKFRSGAIGVIENRLRTGYGYETALEIGGSNGKAVVRDDNTDNLTLYREARSERAHVHWFLERYREAYRTELAAFVEAVRAQRAPEPDFEQGLRVLEACLAAERSYREERVVSLDE